MLNTLPPSHQIHHHHSCLLPHPINLLPHHHHHHHHRLPPTQLSTRILYSLSAIDKHTPPLQKPPDNNDNHKDNNNNINNNNIPFFTRIYNSSPIFLNERPVQKQDSEGPKRQESGWWNMWWGDLKAAVGQRVNVEGLLFSVSVVTRNKKWVIPHVSVPDVRYIDWAALKRKGFEGVVFDKDNTLTVPYSLALFGPISPSVECCKAVFGDNIAVFSNSAGLEEYDPDDRKARALEFVIGIRVIRHKVKKPAGSAEEIERHFGCDSSKLIMVGDRPFTDIVYGNRNGFLTILTAPLSLAEEPFIVKQVRKIELALVNRWSKKGLKADNERLLPDALDCVKEPPFV